MRRARFGLDRSELGFRAAFREPRKTSAHLLGTGVCPAARDASQRAAVSVRTRQLHRSDLAAAQLDERLTRAQAEGLAVARRADARELNAHAPRIDKHVDRAAVDDMRHAAHPMMAGRRKGARYRNRERDRQRRAHGRFNARPRVA